MNEIVSTIIMGVITAVVLPLLGLAGDALIKWIKSKTKNETTANMLSAASTIVLNAVRAVFQTYVEALKKSGEFTAEAQLVALRKAKDIALEQMSEEVKKYLTDTYGDLESWITTKIEATINALKNAPKV